MILNYSSTPKHQESEENTPEKSLLTRRWSSPSGGVAKDNNRQRSSSQVRTHHQEEQVCYFEHEYGSLNLLDACKIKAQHEEEQVNRRQLLRSSVSSQESQCSNISLLTQKSRRSCYSRDSSIEILDAEDVTINDTVQSIVSSNDSWEKIRNQIRERKLVTSLGVIEVCLSSFQEEAVKLTEQRARKAKEAEARLSRYSRLRRRLSLF
jgi:hypothetical protein